MRGTMVVLALVVLAAAGCGSPAVPWPAPASSTAARPVEVVAALAPDVTGREKQAIEAAMSDAPGAGEPWFETVQESYQRFREAFQDDPELLENVTPDSLPATFRVAMPDAASAEPLAAALRDLPGVDDVTVADDPQPRPTG